jgi:hypothetical protein
MIKSKLFSFFVLVQDVSLTNHPLINQRPKIEIYYHFSVIKFVVSANTSVGTLKVSDRW